MAKYVALTIGPIYNTLIQASKTRELWAASYTFSYLMKRILDELHTKKYPFLVPALEVNSDIKQSIFDIVKKEKLGTGLFHDRFIFEDTTGNGIHDLQEVINTVIDGFEESAKSTLSNEGKINAAYLKEYFQFRYIELKLDNIDNGNLIKEIMPLLDGSENQQQFVSNPQEYKLSLSTLGSGKIKSKMTALQELFYKVNKSFLAKDAFDKDEQGKYLSFKSLPEISAFELAVNEKDAYEGILNKVKSGKELKEVMRNTNLEEEYIEQFDFDDELITELSTSKKIKNFQDYHKYICIVQADGDKIGKTIETLSDTNAYQDFSRKLFQFAIKATKQIQGFGGAPIYVGGDDLLFLAPLVGKDNQTIFSLITQLDKTFSKFEWSSNSNPTLSFGVSVTYHKYPMYEALQKAQGLLFGGAKNYPSYFKSPTKNAVAFEWQKHSGTQIQTVLSKNSPVFKYISELKSETIEQDFLSSTMFKIQEFAPMLKKLWMLGKLEENNIKNFARNYLQNSRNKKNEKQNESEDRQLSEFEKAVQNLLIDSFKRLLSTKEKIEEGLSDSRKVLLENAFDDMINEIYAALRFQSFVAKKKKNEQ